MGSHEIRSRCFGAMLVAIASCVAISLWVGRAEAHIYWADGRGIVRADNDGRSVRTVISGSGIGSCGIAVDSAHLYYTDDRHTDWTGVSRANLDGSGQMRVVAPTRSESACAPAVGAGHLFWLREISDPFEDTVIAGANLDGTARNLKLVSRVDDLDTGLAVIEPAVVTDGRYLYFLESFTPPPVCDNCDDIAIGRANLDGTGVRHDLVRLAPYLDGRYGPISVSAGRLFWFDGVHNTIGSANTDGTHINRALVRGAILGDVLARSGIASDNTHVYWEDSDYSIARANLDGAHVKHRYIVDRTGTVQLAVDPHCAGADIDHDSVPDVCDNCPTAANADQRDSNRDGHGDACSGPFLLTVRAQSVDQGSGQLTSASRAIACGSTCSHLYALDADETLIAQPAPGSVFAGWRGACAGVQPRCVVHMDHAQQVIAVFQSLPTTCNAHYVSTVATAQKEYAFGRVSDDMSLTASVPWCSDGRRATLRGRPFIYADVTGSFFQAVVETAVGMTFETDKSQPTSWDVRRLSDGGLHLNVRGKIDVCGNYVEVALDILPVTKIAEIGGLERLPKAERAGAEKELEKYFEDQWRKHLGALFARYTGKLEHFFFNEIIDEIIKRGVKPFLHLTDFCAAFWTPQVGIKLSPDGSHALRWSDEGLLLHLNSFRVKTSQFAAA